MAKEWRKVWQDAGFDDIRFADRGRDRALYGRLAQVVAANRSRAEIPGAGTGREHVLPSPGGGSVRVFSPEGVGQFDGTEPRSEIRLMYEPYMTKVNAQRRLQPFGKKGDAIFAALVGAYDELIFTETNVLDAETQSSEQPEARSVQ